MAKPNETKTILKMLVKNLEERKEEINKSWDSRFYKEKLKLTGELKIIDKLLEVLK